MHKYGNKNYSVTAVKAVFIPYEEEREIEIEAPDTSTTPTKKSCKYLPGERLLKKINKEQKNKKPLNMKTIEKSISKILKGF